MIKPTYNSKAVKASFWFNEFKFAVEMINKGLTIDEIENMQKEDNIFMAPSEDFGRFVFRVIRDRLYTLDDEMKKVFSEASVTDQRIINLFMIVLTDRFFAELLLDVFNEKILIGDTRFNKQDIMNYFIEKSLTEPEIKAYSDSSKNRMAGSYLQYMREGGLLVNNDNSYELIKPVLDMDLEQQISKDKYKPYNKIFLGDKS